MNADDDNILDTESEDEDYAPGGAADHNENVSEEEEDGDPEHKPEKVLKRKRGKAEGSKTTKRGKHTENSDDDSDDLNDVDFAPSEKVSEDEDETEEVEDPEVTAAREKAEKERMDRLYSDFLTSVDKSATKRKEQRDSATSTTEEKIVTKVYDFAGERVEIKEKVRAIKNVSKSSISNGTSNSSPSSSTNGTIESNATDSNQTDASPTKPLRCRVSFLSGDPADIGLSGDKRITAKEGLSNVLNALHARNKKLGTLEKSKLDWESYKREQNIEEELESHNRSKNGFIDRQEFLQRADVRQFEIEKQARSTRRRH